MKTSDQPSMDASSFADAKWIWPRSHSWDIHNGYALFRHHVSLKRVAGAAPLFITADQSYQLYINGHYVCRGPARGFQRHWPYDEVNVAPWLRVGDNLIAVRAYNPGSSNFQYLSQGYAGLLMAARWGTVRIATDGTWRCRRQTGVRCDTVPTSVQLFYQEHIDLQLEDPEWMQPGYDDHLWDSGAASCTHDAMPWAALELRGIPMLEEKIDPQTVRVIGCRTGRCAPGFRDVRDAARLRHGEGLGHEPCRFEAGEIEVPATGKNRFASYLLDFGRTVVGSVGFEIDGAVGGEILDTLHDEVVDPQNLAPRFRPDTNSRAAFSHRLTCRAGAQSHFFYHPFGFRYVVLTVRGATAGLHIRPRLRTTLYPLEQRGTFRCADQTLQAIWDTCAWTQRVCSLDAYVDTPGREQAQWWGDARVQAKNTFFLSGDTRLFRRGIAQIADQRAPSGLTYGHAPTMAHGCILPDFALIWLLTLWDYYWQTESTEPFEAHQDAATDILGYFESMADPKMGLVRFDPRYWLFLDWTEVQREGTPTILNLWLILALEKMAALYRLTGHLAKAASMKKWQRALTGKLQALVDAKGFLRDGYDTRGRRVKEASIHSQVLGLMAGVPGIDKTRVLHEMVLPFLRGEGTFRACPSAYWITYVFEWLREDGHGREVVDFIRRRWSPMITHGTTWEHFEPDGSGGESYSHAWSAHPLFHLMQISGGIVQTAAGWRTIRFEPCFDLDICEAQVPSPRGLIRSSWRREAGRINVELELPPGVEADVFLPGTARTRIGKSKRWELRAES